ncbi:hypothetical protein SSE37_25268 [Sagittula stellata E-37]|uniref:Uncharacterized protein n=2 Tax=Sagittula stellata TaxID=52603 RepID=A3KA37_SAGS3|nr:hypothetical protein SSE37_25268 [Sagittula stellata E-37]
MMVVPLEVAEELQAMRQELATLRAALTPLLADAGWLTVHDAAMKYRVSESTINRWVQAGRMEAKGAGASRRVKMIA